MTKNIICTILFLHISFFLLSQNSIVKFDKLIYKRGDTMYLDFQRKDYITDSIRFATVYLLIEKTDSTKKRWVYRYPLIDGIGSASFKIDSSLSEGSYAFAFLFRKKFFSINGTADDTKDGGLVYSVLTKNDDSRIDKINTDKKGNFFIRGILYEDTSYFVFSRSAQNGQNPLKIGIQTPLDSAFKSDSVFTQIIKVGDYLMENKEEENYQPDLSNFNMQTLPDITVSAKKKRKVDLYNEEFSTGLFRNGNAIIFDGLESPKIAQSNNVFDFLKSKVAGLIIKSDGIHMNMQWRGAGVDVFLDEYRLSELGDSPTYNIIDPADVAMIKVYQPPAYLTPGGDKAAIAIYTKNGSYEDPSAKKNRFKIFGYSPANAVWK